MPTRVDPALYYAAVFAVAGAIVEYQKDGRLDVAALTPLCEWLVEVGPEGPEPPADEDETTTH